MINQNHSVNPYIVVVQKFCIFANFVIIEFCYCLYEESMDLSRNSTTNSLKIELAKCKAENSKLKKEAAETIKEEFKELGKIAQCRLKFKALEKKHENQINSLKDELETFQKRLTIINEENRLQEEKNEQLRRQGQYLRIQCEQNKTLIESFYDDNNKLELKKIELETAVEQLQAELARHQEELRTTIIGENLRKTDLEIAAFQNEIKMKDEIWQGHLIELSRINSQAEDSELEFAVSLRSFDLLIMT